MNNIKYLEKATTEYIRWVENTKDNPEMQEELSFLKGDVESVVDAFYEGLEFGTSGLRGVLGPGTNRMNEYVIRRATLGVARYLNHAMENASVVICYDSRRKSFEFAHETAKVLSAQGIKVYISKELMPVSFLSYAIRKLECNMGIMITASHNPKIFNGYKVYNEEGYQIVGDVPKLILNEINQIDYFEGIPKDDSHVQTIPDQVFEDFVQEIGEMSVIPSIDPLKKNLSIVYTPLNGAGNKVVRRVLKDAGFTDVNVVKSQELPDENFTTCPSPNPEKITAYREAFAVMDEKHADLIIATDPDSDRLGVCLYDGDVKALLTGNQLGILLFDFLCQMKKPKKGQILVKSIVSAPLVEKIAADYGVRVVNTLTGFKYIGEVITKLTACGNEDLYYFGFEESNGYLVSPYIRDKDGVSAALLTCEMAAYYKAKGLTLMDRLNEIFDQYGREIDKTFDHYFEGPAGKKIMKSLMEHFRCNVNDEICGRKILMKKDYLENTGLPKSNVLEYLLDDGNRILIRPSGTEAKLRVYYFKSDNKNELETFINGVIESYNMAK